MGKHTAGIVLSFVVGAVAAFGATARPLDAHAAYRRYMAQFCDSRDNYALNYFVGELGAVGALNNYGSRQQFLYCPVIDDSTFAKSGVTQLNVHAYDGNGNRSVSAQACVQFYGWLGGSCGTWANSGSATINSVTLQPSVSVWQNAENAAHFPYVFVMLPATGAGGASRLYGYYVQ